MIAATQINGRDGKLHSGIGVFRNDATGSASLTFTRPVCVLDDEGRQALITALTRPHAPAAPLRPLKPLAKHRAKGRG